MRIFSALLALALVTAAPAFAAPPESHNLRVVKRSTLDGEMIQPGRYRLVVHEGGRDRVVVQLFRGGELVAAAPAKRIEREAVARHTGMVLLPNGEGRNEIYEIHVKGQRNSIVFFM